MTEINEALARKFAGREYRLFETSGLELRADEESGSMIVEGYATTFNQRYVLYSYDGYTVREQIAPTAFDGCDMSDVIMQYNHDGHVFARTSNHTLDITIDSTGLRIRADLSGTEIGRQLYSEIKGGYTTKMSFGFIADEDTRDVKQDHQTGSVDVLRTVTKIRKLYDVSAVSRPANDTTGISARCFSDGVIAEILEECRESAKMRLALRLRL